MPSDGARTAWLTILINAGYARDWTDGVSLEAFAADRRTFYAVTRALEIVSEAARRLDEPSRERHPHLPWKQIMGAGNVYRHDYDNVVESLVWRTVQERVPEILAAAEAEVGDSA